MSSKRCEAPLCIALATGYAQIEGKGHKIYICPKHIAELNANGEKYNNPVKHVYAPGSEPV